MDLFEFEYNLKKLDERSIFANRICKFIYLKHNGDLVAAIKEAEPFLIDLETFVRNIYELVENEIPLYAYYQFVKFGADNYGFKEEDTDEILSKIKDACKFYYSE